MADRTLVYPNEVPFDVDILLSQKNYYEALASYMDTVTGSSVSLNGLNCTPSTPAALTVDVEPGQIYSLQVTDATTYGAVPADPALIVKQAILSETTTLSTLAPVTVGDSIKYLIQVAYSQVDGVPVNRTFFSAPSAVVDTQRQNLAVVEAKAGVSAPTGTEVAPSPDAGFTGAWIVTVAFGQTTVTAPDIVVDPTAPFITEKLQDKISLATADARFVLQPPLQSAPYVIRAIIDTDVVYSPGTNTILFDVVEENIASWYDSAIGRITPTFPCWMNISANMALNTTLGTSAVLFALRVNGAPVWAMDAINLDSTFQNGFGSWSTNVLFNGTTDYIDVILISDNVDVELIGSTYPANLSAFIIAN